MDPIVEILPITPERGIGVSVYTLPTNVRFFKDTFWDRNVTLRDPFVDSVVVDDGAKLIKPGDAAQVKLFKKDRYGNVWAIFDRVHMVAAVTIYQGQQRIIFYPVLTMFDYDELRKEGELGKSVKPISIGSVVS